MSRILHAITFTDTYNGNFAEDQFNKYCEENAINKENTYSVTVNVIQPVPDLSQPQTQITLIHFKKAD